MGIFFASKAEKERDARAGETQRAQAAAADPEASAWVSANAGTGKTHVLTMRVLRLLLGGTPPERILALTYTKAAAAEMSKRVFARLAEWVTADDASLKDTLAQLLDRAPTPDEQHRARQLFAIAIETPGGLKVQTIHAFCERLLQRFPLEAGVPAGFVILDEHERDVLLRQATDEMLSEATGANGGPLRPALEKAIKYAVNEGFDGILQQVLADRDGALRPLEEAKLAALEVRLRATFGVRSGITADALVSELSATCAEELLPLLAAALRGGGKSDQEQAEYLRLAIAAGSPSRRVEALADFFLTQARKPRDRLATKRVLDTYSELIERAKDAQTRFVALHVEHKGLMVVEATVALLRLGGDVLARYRDAKARNAALDFEDLVGRAAGLLASSQAVDWVLYKLDGGLDHILVDEAQDTSPAQWEVIRALAEEFFSGSGARDVTRTLFAVGDEKQSIYSFQGAAPTMFADMGEKFAEQAARGNLQLRRVPLTLSFRSVEPLLAAVDAVFADRIRTPGLTATASQIQHIAHRVGHAGLIEIWETEKAEEATSTEPWSPLDETVPSSPVARLAARIAQTIDGWLKSGEILASENRPIRAGDVLILVCKRTPFAPVMISALKARGIRVAGADRLILTDQIAVQDLMALGDFLCLPEDDLALASVLKSPLFGLGDDDLLTIAPKRKGSLWQELLARADTDPRFAAATETLKRWKARADVMPPFEFFCALFDADGMRARMLERLGAEAADAIDELLNLALAYDETAAPSLQGFLSWLREGTRIIKRDMEQGLDEVRVMTVHGAKGLEAPIVFLPDTCSTRSGRQPVSLLTLDATRGTNGGAAPSVWPVKGTSDLAPLQQAKAGVARAETEERNRLLYVALTRARDRLYVSGFEGTKPAPADCWYNLIKVGLADQLEEATTSDGRVAWRIASKQTAKHEAAKSHAPASPGSMPLPAWARRPAPPEPLLTVPLAPSRLAALETDTDGERLEQTADRLAEPPILPPSALAEDARFLRGTLTHALLEHLPTLPKERWATAAEAFISGRGRQLAAAVRKGIVTETLAILRDPAFAALFGPEARAEVAIVAEVPHPSGRGPALRLAGKIDRLVRDLDSILIVDYKTNRPPPKEVAKVAEAYLLQLAAYRLAIGHIFSQQRVRAAILWTDGPRIMEIPADMLDAAEQRLWQPSPADP
jgi:ATP-dependent helicase/nuclease subunit A